MNTGEQIWRCIVAAVGFVLCGVFLTFIFLGWAAGIVQLVAGLIFEPVLRWWRR